MDKLREAIDWYLWALEMTISGLVKLYELCGGSQLHMTSTTTHEHPAKNEVVASELLSSTSLLREHCESGDSNTALDIVNDGGQTSPTAPTLRSLDVVPSSISLTQESGTNLTSKELKCQWRMLAYHLNQDLRRGAPFTVQVLHWNQHGNLGWDAIKADGLSMRGPVQSRVTLNVPAGVKVHRWYLNDQLEWVKDIQALNNSTVNYFDIIDQCPSFHA